jgi:hypothetical protein
METFHQVVVDLVLVGLVVDLVGVGVGGGEDLDLGVVGVVLVQVVLV